jgi:hypothetical protein
MKPGKLLLLLVIAAALVALSLWSSRQRRAAPPSDVGRKLLPALDLQSVARVEITRQGKPVKLVRKGEEWVVADLFNYPVNVSKLQSALLTLAGLKIGEVSRGVNIDTNATLVDLQDQSGRPLVSLRLGPASGGGMMMAMGGGRFPPRAPAAGRHVAVAGNNQVYLVKDGLESFDGAASDWAGNELLNLSTADIQSVELAGPAGNLTLTREGSALQLAGLAANEELDSNKSYDLESVFRYLRFTGVADPGLTPAQTGLATAGTYRVTTKAGDVYTARIGGAATSGDRYLRLEAALAAPGTNATAKTEYETRKAELDQKFITWTYLVAPASAANMTLTRADLVKPKVVTTNETASAQDAATP